jgi:peptidyl-prolyl cis-trans isomerase SurA
MMSMKIPTAFAFSLVALSVLAASDAQSQTLRPSFELGNFSLIRTKSTAPQQADFIVAIVNSEPVTNNEVRSRLLRLEQQLAQRGGAMPPREELARQVLERIVSEKAQLHLAREMGLKIDESVIDQAELSVARQNQVTRDELYRKLASDGLSVAQFREDLRDQLLLTRLREREVENRVQVSDTDIDQFLKDQQDNADPALMEVNLSQILVAVPETSTPAQVAALKARAIRALERARAGEDFGALVREYSDAPDRANDGVLGLRSLDRYPALFSEAVQSLAAPALVGPLQSGAGFHILKLTEKKAPGMPSVNVVQSRARHILLRLTPQLPESVAKERLQEIRKRIEAGQLDFASAARENSQDGSAKDGGDLGWTSPGQFVPEFEEVMNTLMPGQISLPLTSRFGVHLIQLVERRQSTLSQREQREIARGLVREKKTDEAYVNWASEVRGRAYVEFREPPQ